MPRDDPNPASARAALAFDHFPRLSSRVTLPPPCNPEPVYGADGRRKAAMDQPPYASAPSASNNVSSEAPSAPSLAPPNAPSSALSDPPATDPVEPAVTLQTSAEQQPIAKEGTPYQLSAQTEEVLKRININAANAAAAGQPGWEAAKEQIMRDYPTAEKLATPTPGPEIVGGMAGATVTGKRKRGSTEGDGSATITPGSATARGTSKRGRPRGRGRGGSTRGVKRKRMSRPDKDSEDDGDDSDSSIEISTPLATHTKSGRSISKPTAYVPPPLPSPTATGSAKKRKRVYRPPKNPDAVVCKQCLRGVSPKGNEVVFCDSCNGAWHRYCHFPVIDQSVIDVVDKEWFCKSCEEERAAEVDPGAEVDGVPSAEGKEAHVAPNSNTAPPAALSMNGHGHAHPQPPALQPRPLISHQFVPASTVAPAGLAFNGAYAIPPLPNAYYDHVPEGHPSNYPRPGYGLMRTLPPEQEDYRWLVDDDAAGPGAFTHLYRDPSSGMGGGKGG